MQNAHCQWRLRSTALKMGMISQKRLRELLVKFEELNLELFKKTLSKCSRMLKSGIDEVWNFFDKVCTFVDLLVKIVHVGGSTRIPKVQEPLKITLAKNHLEVSTRTKLLPMLLSFKGPFCLASVKGQVDDITLLDIYSWHRNYWRGIRPIIKETPLSEEEWNHAEF